MKLFTRFAAILLPILLFAFFTSCNENGDGPELIILELEGKVVDSEAKAIENAVVSAVASAEGSSVEIITLFARDTTDANGNFLLRNVPADLSKVRIIIEHPDFNTFDESAKVIEDNNGNINDNTYRLERKDKEDCCNVVYILAADKTKNEPIPHASIKITKDNEIIREGTTDDRGLAVFRELCDGKYWIRLAAEGYKVIEKEFSVDNCDTLELVFNMQPIEDECCDGKIIIRPVDEKNNEPINGAKVLLWKNGKNIAEAIVKNGVAYFEKMCEGGYGVSIIAEGYKPIEFELNLPCNETIEFSKKMMKSDDCCKGVIKFIVRNGEGQHLNGAKVTLWYGDNKYEEGTVKDGKVIFDGLCEGKYGVGITLEGYEGIEFHVELACNEKKVVEKILLKKDDCCKGIIRIKVQGQDGKPLNGAKVTLWFGNQMLEKAEVRDGWAVFDGLCEGKYGVDIEMEGYKHQEFAIELGCNEEKTFEKILLKSDDCCTAVMKLIIKDKETSETIEGANVTIYIDREVIADGTTGRNGVFEKGELCAPRIYVIVVEKDGYQTIEEEMIFKECKLYQETFYIKTR